MTTSLQANDEAINRTATAISSVEVLGDPFVTLLMNNAPRDTTAEAIEWAWKVCCDLARTALATRLQYALDAEAQENQAAGLTGWEKT